jgi:hypothetical protein
VEIGLGQLDQSLELLKRNNAAGFRALGQWHGFEKVVADSRYQTLVSHGL